MQKNKERIKSTTELLLALLYSPGPNGKIAEEIKGITRLQKLMFILENESIMNAVLKDLSQFRPYKYGPFSPKIFDSLEFLEDLNLIKIEDKNVNFEPDSEEEIDVFLKEARFEDEEKSIGEDHRAGKIIHVYSLTDSGMKKAEDIYKKLPEKQKNSISEIKSKFNKMPLRQLLFYVYTNFPEYASNSDIKNKITRNKYVHKY